MANTLNLGDGNWGVKDSSLLGYAKDGTKFLPETFDVTRASSGTRVNKDGLIETPTEIVSGDLVSNGDFSNGLTDWIVDDGTSWTNVGNTAFCDGNNGLIKQSFTSTQSKVYIVTFDSVINGAGLLGVRVGSGAYEWKLYPTGTHNIYITAGSINTQGVTFYATDAWTGSIDNVSVVEINQDNLARIDYTDGVEGVLLTEPQSTNLLPYSENFSQWNKSVSSIVLLDGQSSPDGENNAYLMTSASDGAYVYLNQNLSNEGTTSVYVKSNNLTGEFYISTPEGGLVSQTVTSEWTRVQLTSTPSSSNFRVWLRLENSGDSVYIFGAQLEELPYATSYIPTYGQIASRAGDLVNNAGDVNNFNSEEGVLFVETSALTDDEDTRISINDGTTNNYISIGYSRFSGNIIAEIFAGGVLQTTDWGAIGVNKLINHKFALSWGSGTMSFYMDGSISNTESITSPTGLNKLTLANDVSHLPFYGKTKNIQVFNTALTDAELITLTTI